MGENAKEPKHANNGLPNIVSFPKVFIQPEKRELTRINGAKRGLSNKMTLNNENLFKILKIH